MIEVIVSGAAGRMGREVVRAVTAEPDMRVAAAVDPAGAGSAVDDGVGGAVPVIAELSGALPGPKPRVMVDFTHPDAAAGNVRLALAAGVDCVVGTTGIEEGEWRLLVSDTQDDTCLLVAPNFAIGAVLMMDFATRAARFMPHAEIVELHHDGKADAPSGTAIRTAGLIGAARSETPAPSSAGEKVLPGARGADVAGIPVHSVRLPGLVAHQEVIFGHIGQTLSIRHDSIDRTSFMPGVVLAIREVVSRAGLVIGLEGLMNL